MNLQELANEFNKRYIKATRTSLPEDYGEATMIARQLVLELDKNLVIDDNFDGELVEQEGEII